MRILHATLRSPMALESVLQPLKGTQQNALIKFLNNGMYIEVMNRTDTVPISITILSTFFLTYRFNPDRHRHHVMLPNGSWSYILHLTALFDYLESANSYEDGLVLKVSSFHGGNATFRFMSIDHRRDPPRCSFRTMQTHSADDRYWTFMSHVRNTHCDGFEMHMYLHDIVAFDNILRLTIRNESYLNLILSNSGIMVVALGGPNSHPFTDNIQCDVVGVPNGDDMWEYRLSLDPHDLRSFNQAVHMSTFLKIRIAHPALQNPFHPLWPVISVIASETVQYNFCCSDQLAWSR